MRPGVRKGPTVKWFNPGEALIPNLLNLISEPRVAPCTPSKASAPRTGPTLEIRMLSCSKTGNLSSGHVSAVPQSSGSLRAVFWAQRLPQPSPRAHHPISYNLRGHGLWKHVFDAPLRKIKCCQLHYDAWLSGYVICEMQSNFQDTEVSENVCPGRDTCRPLSACVG